MTDGKTHKEVSQNTLAKIARPRTISFYHIPIKHKLQYTYFSVMRY